MTSDVWDAQLDYSTEESVSKSINSEYDYSLPVSQIQNYSNVYSESSEIESDTTLTNSNSDLEQFRFSVSSESSEDLQYESERSVDSEYTESERDSVSEVNNEIKRPVLRYYSTRIVSPARSNTKISNQNHLKKLEKIKDKTTKINSKVNKPQVPDFRDVSEYQLTPTYCSEKEFNQKPSCFQLASVLKRGYKITAKIKKFLSVYRHNHGRHKTSSSPTSPQLDPELAITIDNNYLAGVSEECLKPCSFSVMENTVNHDQDTLPVAQKLLH